MFLDDDAELTVDLDDVLEAWDGEWTALCGVIADPDTGQPLRDYPTSPRTLGSTSVFLYAVEAAMLFVTERLVAVGGYDEEMGPGRRYGADEGVDLSFRLMQRGWSTGFVPMQLAVHPDQETMALDKRRSYGRGTGYALRRHLRTHSSWPYAVRTYLGMPASICARAVTGDRVGARRRIARMRGVIEATFERRR